MAERIGIVIESETDGYARIVTERKDACGGCSPSSGACSTCLTSAKMVSRVHNPIGAHQGDIVKVSLKTATLFKSAALLYLIPVAGLLTGLLIGAGTAAHWPFSPLAAAIIGALSGGAGGFWLVTRISRTPSVAHRLTPVITAVVGRSAAMPVITP